MLQAGQSRSSEDDPGETVASKKQAPTHIQAGGCYSAWREEAHRGASRVHALLCAVSPCVRPNLQETYKSHDVISGEIVCGKRGGGSVSALGSAWSGDCPVGMKGTDNKQVRKHSVHCEELSTWWSFITGALGP